ncbi:MAG: ABC transporter permease, partial [Neglectibacter sp.]
TPNRRSKLALTQAIVMVLLLFCLTLYMTGLLLGLSAALFPGELDCGAFLLLNAGLFGLYLFLSGLCFCTACLWSEPRLATGVGAGACIAFVLLQMLSRVGEKFEWLKYATPLTLFDPQGLIGGEPSAVWSFLLLYTGGLALYGVGIAVFCRRDIPA